MQIQFVDFIVFFAFTLGTVLFGVSFAKNNKSTLDYTSAGGGMSGFIVGMSVFATYVSSISFLGLPGSAYLLNWNPLVFSLSIPIATFFAAKYFVPFYRNLQSVSAYSFLEERFGYWARIYAATCYILTQIARIGSVLFLLALPLHSMLGWSIPAIIIIAGICVIIYAVLGGIKAVIWTDAIQGIILIVGAITCLIVLFVHIPGGLTQIISVGSEYNKFSLGSMSASWSEQTFWVTLIYGIFINLQNYGIDQNYVQRYKTAKDLKSARSAALFGGWLYVPVSWFFLIIGTLLFVYYKTNSGLLPSSITPDQVFPYFIVNGLPVGVTGLLIAAIFAAGMSTVATSINSGATIFLADFIEHNKPSLTDKQKMNILYLTSLCLGILGIGVGLLMISVKSALDAWWTLAGIFSGGMLGLFLLAYIARHIKGAHALIGAITGVAFIAWLSLSGQTVFHSYWTIVLGTLTIFCVGLLISLFYPKRKIHEY